MWTWFRRLILYPLSLILLAATVFSVNLLYFRPVLINTFFERVFIMFALESPELLTATRILKPLGIDFYHDDLADQSDAQALKQIERLKKDYGQLLAYDAGKLKDQTRLSRDVLVAFLEPQIEGEPFRLHNYPINQLFGYQSGFPDFMIQQHWVEDEKDAEAYVSRLTKAPDAFDQIRAGLKAREDAGIMPPKFVIERTIAEMEAFVGQPAQENPLYVEFEKKLIEAGLDDDARERFLADANNAIMAAVYPAYQRLIEYQKGALTRATTDDGVWKLPDGAAFYDLALWQNTTTKLTADQIHQRGVDEVARIQGEMLKILEAEGYDVAGGFSAAMAELNADPEQYYPDTDEGRAQILRDYAAINDEVEAVMDQAFNLRHKAKLEVKRVPEFMEKTAPGAYYQSPSLDGSRAGTFFANLYDIQSTRKYEMRALTCHEGVPGHHMQKAIQGELQGLPTFRRLLPFTAFAEGWGLYSERVCSELGIMKTPLDELGRYQYELFRAVRLVVDTGIHAKRWTREEAIDYMKSNTGMAESEVVAEIERYIVMPGQATAYKVGLDFILAERARAEAALGDAFDVRGFHDAILRNGDLPLSILGEQIDAFIEAEQAKLDG